LDQIARPASKALRNVGKLRKIKGEYITFLNQDDLLTLKDHLSKCVAEIPGIAS